MKFRTNQKEHPDLSIKTLARIQDIFTKNNWPLDLPFSENVFDNFCNMLATIDDDKCELILKLTEKFLWVQESEYMKYFAIVFDKFINASVHMNEKKLYICPILSQNDFGKSKSSGFLFYLVKSHLKAIQGKYNSYSITGIDSPHAADINFIKRNNYTVCLIDDFIGTGETAHETALFFESKGISKDMITIISLVAMKEGSLFLKEKGYNTYSAVNCEKGISTTKNQADIKLMQDIEHEIGVNDEFKFGYGASEALIKMSRTPNNTFPVYWLRNKKNKYAPFWR